MPDSHRPGAEPDPAAQRAFVLTVSDRSARGERPDTSGDVLQARLTELGFVVDRAIVPDDGTLIAGAVRGAIPDHVLVVTTGGTGMGPRDVTPQAVLPLLDYVVPGLGEAMRAFGMRSTPNAALSRSFGGVLRGRLILALPGSPAGARESLDAVAGILAHALSTLAGGGHDPAPPAGGHDATGPVSAERAGEGSRHSR